MQFKKSLLLSMAALPWADSFGSIAFGTEGRDRDYDPNAPNDVYRFVNPRDVAIDPVTKVETDFLTMNEETACSRIMDNQLRYGKYKPIKTAKDCKDAAKQIKKRKKWKAHRATFLQPGDGSKIPKSWNYIPKYNPSTCYVHFKQKYPDWTDPKKRDAKKLDVDKTKREAGAIKKADKRNQAFIFNPAGADNVKVLDNDASKSTGNPVVPLTSVRYVCKYHGIDPEFPIPSCDPTTSEKGCKCIATSQGYSSICYLRTTSETYCKNHVLGEENYPYKTQCDWVKSF